MKQPNIDRITKDGGLGFFGCYRGGDGRCYYLCGMASTTAYGDKSGYVFRAFIENHYGELVLACTFGFFVSGSALATARVKQLMGDRTDYLKRAGLAHLKALLDRGDKLEPEYRIDLNSNSSDADFAIPTGTDPLIAQRQLREEILRELAVLHSEGHQHIPVPTLLDRLCTEMDWFDRALKILAQQGFVRQPGGSLLLTEAGHLEAEKTIPAAIHPVPTDRSSRPSSTPPAYDCFVSYAGQDRPMVKELVKALNDRDIHVWWDKGQITLGDKLSQKIEEGLRSSRYGLVIVSPHFIAKRWPDAEIRALASRAINTGTKVVLPVLVGITHGQFAAEYPLLGDLVSTEFSGDYAGLIDEIVRAIDKR